MLALKNLFCNFLIFKTISNHVEESRTPPPAYGITILNGESMYVPPSYRMLFHSSQSYSQDSYGGIPDYSCYNRGTISNHVWLGIEVYIILKNKIK